MSNQTSLLDFFQRQTMQRPLVVQQTPALAELEAKCVDLTEEEEEDDKENPTNNSNVQQSSSTWTEMKKQVQKPQEQLVAAIPSSSFMPPSFTASKHSTTAAAAESQVTNINNNDENPSVRLHLFSHVCIPKNSENSTLDVPMSEWMQWLSIYQFLSSFPDMRYYGDDNNENNEDLIKFDEFINNVLLETETGEWCVLYALPMLRMLVTKELGDALSPATFITLMSITMSESISEDDHLLPIDEQWIKTLQKSTWSDMSRPDQLRGWLSLIHELSSSEDFCTHIRNVKQSERQVPKKPTMPDPIQYSDVACTPEEPKLRIEKDNLQTRKYYSDLQEWEDQKDKMRLEVAKLRGAPFMHWLGNDRKGRTYNWFQEFGIIIITSAPSKPSLTCDDESKENDAPPVATSVQVLAEKCGIIYNVEELVSLLCWLHPTQCADRNLTKNLRRWMDVIKQSIVDNSSQYKNWYVRKTKDRVLQEISMEVETGDEVMESKQSWNELVIIDRQRMWEDVLKSLESIRAHVPNIPADLNVFVLPTLDQECVVALSTLNIATIEDLKSSLCECMRHFTEEFYTLKNVDCDSCVMCDMDDDNSQDVIAIDIRNTNSWMNKVNACMNWNTLTFVLWHFSTHAQKVAECMETLVPKATKLAQAKEKKETAALKRQESARENRLLADEKRAARVAEMAAKRGLSSENTSDDDEEPMMRRSSRTITKPEILSEAIETEHHGSSNQRSTRNSTRNVSRQEESSDNEDGDSSSESDSSSEDEVVASGRILRNSKRKIDNDSEPAGRQLRSGKVVPPRKSSRKVVKRIEVEDDEEEEEDQEEPEADPIICDDLVAAAIFQEFVAGSDL